MLQTYSMGYQHRPFTLIGKGITVPSSNFKRDIHYKPESYSSKVNSTSKAPKHFTQLGKSTLLSTNQQLGSNWIGHSPNNGAYTFWTHFVSKDYQGSSHLAKHQRTHDWPNKNVPRLARPWSCRAQRPKSSCMKETVLTSRPQMLSYPEQSDDANLSYNFKKCAFSTVMKNPALQLNNLSAEASSVGRDRHKYISAKYETDPGDIETSETKQGIELSLSGLLENDLSSPKLKLNLEFHDRNVKTSDELIERALRLTKKAKEESMKSRPTTPQKVAWDKLPPNDCSHGNARTLAVDWVFQHDTLSATGRRLSFSSRHSCPASARNRRKSSWRPHSSQETTRKPAWKP